MVEKVQELSDVELAVLLSLMANQHCMIQTEDEALPSLESELRLVSRAGLLVECLAERASDCPECIRSYFCSGSLS